MTPCKVLSWNVGPVHMSMLYQGYVAFEVNWDGNGSALQGVGYAFQTFAETAKRCPFTSLIT